nr:hypothetical protein [Allomuricauda sp.]
MHLNKTAYVQGEEIWFAGYILNQKSKKPFSKTTNVYIGVYDSIGNQLNKHLFLSRGGYFKGNIFLDSTYLAGTYYLKAHTNWMRNFREIDGFVQRIKVLSSSTLQNVTQSVISNYDVQFLPEGGNMLSGVDNNVGVKILNNKGYGVAVNDIKIIDSRGVLVAEVSTSKLGMAKFGIKPLKGVSYHAEISFADGTSETYRLLEPEPRGVNIKFQNNPYHNKVGLMFETNKETVQTSTKSEFYFLLHQDGKSKKVPVKFNAAKLSEVFFLDRNELEKGVNLITLFDSENRPILERMFFNKKDLLSHSTSASTGISGKDSLIVSLNTELPNAQLSVSVLPSNTLAYDPSDNIFSALYLRPYVSGFIENPGYYFSSDSNKKDYELDLLLLTQGWSRFDWNNIFNKPPTEDYVFEDGMILNGTLNALSTNYEGQLVLHNTKYHGKQFISVDDEKNKFLVTSFFPEKDEKMFLSIADKKGKLSRPGAYVTFTSQKYRDRINQIWADNDKTMQSFQSYVRDVDNMITDKTIQLNEVVLTEEKRVPLAENNPFVPAFLKSKVTEINQRAVEDYPRFIDLLRVEGRYDVSESGVRSRRGGGINFVLDGQFQPNLDILFSLWTGQVESYWVDRLSRYEGARSRLRETVYVFSRRGKELLRRDDTVPGSALEIQVKNGFEPTKSFYMPKYATFADKAFENFGTIHWESGLMLDEKGRCQFNVLDTGTKNISLFIEGMSPDGQFLSSLVTVKAPSSK